MTFPRLPSPQEIKKNEDLGLWHKQGPVADIARWARETPDRDAVVDTKARLTWKQLADAIVDIARGLLAIGVKRQDRVAVQLPNEWECLALHMALEGIGAVSLPMPPNYRLKEVRYITQLTEAKAVIVVPQFRRFDHVALFEEVRAQVPSLKSFVTVGASDKPLPAGWTTFEQMIEAGRKAGGPTIDDLAKADPNVLVEVVFTSGSTGDPKGVMHTSNTLTVEDLTHALVNKVGRDDCVFMPSTLGHQLGFSIGLRMPMLVGAKVVYIDTWSAELAIEMIDREKCTFAASTPTFMADILASPKLAEHGGLRCLKTWEIGGAVVTSAHYEQTWAKMPETRIAHAFGITETGGMIIAPPDRPREKLLATGIPHRDFEIKIVDPEGKAVPPDTDGELLQKGSSLFLGYYGKPELTAACYTPDGYYHSGDQVRMDKDGWIYVTGRIKDLIKRGGENVSPVEIEEILASHPSVADVAVVGLPDERLGEKVCAAVILREGTKFTFEDMTAWIAKTGLQKQKWPERLAIVETLPKTSIGKVHKGDLRAQLLK